MWTPEPLWYDRNGNKIYEVLEWAKLMEDMQYRRVAQDTIPNGMWISTVWLGLDHNFLNDGPPLIFESRVFNKKCPHEPKLPRECDCFDEIETMRYSTEQEALEGHRQLVEKYMTQKALPPAQKALPPAQEETG